MKNEDIKPDVLRMRLLEIVRLCADYCFVCENAREMDKKEFVQRILNVLPRIYWEFLDVECDVVALEDTDYYASYVDEDYYESIRRNIESVLGEDDMYLETFEEDMKYSEQPIPASVAEGLADIFQPLYNFISGVKDTDGDNITDAYISCREDFDSYWSQTLCNVLRAINNIRLNITN